MWMQFASLIATIYISSSVNMHHNIVWRFCLESSYFSLLLFFGLWGKHCGHFLSFSHTILVMLCLVEANLVIGCLGSSTVHSQVRAWSPGLQVLFIKQCNICHWTARQQMCTLHATRFSCITHTQTLLPGCCWTTLDFTTVCAVHVRMYCAILCTFWNLTLHSTVNCLKVTSVSGQW